MCSLGREYNLCSYFQVALLHCNPCLLLAFKVKHLLVLSAFHFFSFCVLLCVNKWNPLQPITSWRVFQTGFVLPFLWKGNCSNWKSTETGCLVFLKTLSKWAGAQVYLMLCRTGGCFKMGVVRVLKCWETECLVFTGQWGLMMRARCAVIAAPASLGAGTVGGLQCLLCFYTLGLGGGYAAPPLAHLTMQRSHVSVVRLKNEFFSIWLLLTSLRYLGSMLGLQLSTERNILCVNCWCLM